MKVEKIDHIHVIVKDMNKAINFFSEILGSKFVGPIDKGDHLIAFDSLGFELVFPKTDEPPKHLKEGVTEIKEGLFSISLKVPNRDEAVSELEAKGIRCLWRGNYPDLKTAQMNPAETYGVWLELLEYDHVPSIALANLSKTSEIPFFKG